MAALHRGHGRLEAGGGEELERGQHAPVDRAGADVAGAAGVDVDARVGEHVAAQRVLAHQQDLAERRLLGVVAEERVLALGAVDRGRLEQLPAVEDRLRIDARGAAAGGAELEQHVRRLDQVGLADAAEDRAGDDARALLERPLDEVLGVEADRGRVGGLVGVAELRVAARGHRVRARRVGEQALLGGRGGRQHRGGRGARGAGHGAAGAAGGARRRARGAGALAVAEAGTVGLASALGSSSSLAICFLVVLRGFGAG